jgi:hypothetical protein
VGFLSGLLYAAEVVVALPRDGIVERAHGVAATLYLLSLTTRIGRIIPKPRTKAIDEKISREEES